MGTLRGGRLGLSAWWRERLTGTLVGAGILYVVNFPRILTLLTVGLLYRSWFKVTHLYAWQAVLLPVSGGCWIAWGQPDSPDRAAPTRRSRPSSMSSRDPNAIV